MRPYLITAKLMRPSNMKRFPTPGLEASDVWLTIIVAYSVASQCMQFLNVIIVKLERLSVYLGLKMDSYLQIADR
jgi:hypothetical protein